MSSDVGSLPNGSMDEFPGHYEKTSAGSESHLYEVLKQQKSAKKTRFTSSWKCCVLFGFIICILFTFLACAIVYIVLKCKYLFLFCLTVPTRHYWFCLLLKGICITFYGQQILTEVFVPCRGKKRNVSFFSCRGQL